MATAIDDALAALRETGGAVEFMELAARAARRLPAVLNAVAEGADAFARRTDGVKSGIGDPTAARAIFELTTARAWLESLERERVELEQTIGRALALIESVRESMGDGCADALERHYVDGEPWQDVADDAGVTYRTVMYRRESALVYLDDLAHYGD